MCAFADGEAQPRVALRNRLPFDYCLFYVILEKNTLNIDSS